MSVKPERVKSKEQVEQFSSHYYRTVTAFECLDDYGVKAIWAGIQYGDLEPSIPDGIKKRIGFREYGSWVAYETS